MVIAEEKLKVEKYNKSNKPYLLVRRFSHLSERERDFIKKSEKDVAASKSVVYLLSFKERAIGLISLSVASIDSFPIGMIDYIFVDKEFRKSPIVQVGNELIKVSEFLILLAIKIFVRIQQDVGLTYVGLKPDNDKLAKYYKQLGFNRFRKFDVYIMKLD